MQQAEDFRQEARALAAILEPLDDASFDTPTLFKGWTIDDVIGHLHMFDIAALKAQESDAAFGEFAAPLMKSIAQGKSLRDYQYVYLDGLHGRPLFEAWRDTAEKLADAYSTVDPKKRVKWVGPDMSALSSITARQMETWAHGQEVFDALGMERQEADRIRNIDHLGVVTYGWTFMNRKLPVPEPKPYVRLTGPSGAVWEWNDPQDDNCVSGSAVEFAQVVTQVRSIDDTSLETKGDAARDWMRMAQCFAGPVEEPPAKGARHKAEA